MAWWPSLPRTHLEMLAARPRCSMVDHAGTSTARGIGRSCLPPHCGNEAILRVSTANESKESKKRSQSGVGVHADELKML